MFKIICRLENASNEINGIAFEPLPDGGVMSVAEYEYDVAGQFHGIHGYEVVKAKDVAADGDSSKAPKKSGRGKNAAAAEPSLLGDQSDAGQSDTDTAVAGGDESLAGGAGDDSVAGGEATDAAADGESLALEGQPAGDAF